MRAPGMVFAEEDAIGRRGNCGSCVYWEKVHQEDEMQAEGICRRRAPIGVPSEYIQDNGKDPSGKYGLTTAWPRTFEEEDWCGEFVLKAFLGGVLAKDVQKRLEEDEKD
jgi:hypothetical protein